MAPPGYLRSKLSQPQLQPHIVSRPRFGDRLAFNQGELTLVSAPAGYGKTTLLSQAASASTNRIVWFTIDSLDNDPVRFWSHMAAGLVTDEAVRTDLMDRLDPHSLLDIVDELLGLIEASETGVTLVLDDFHEISNLKIIEAVGRIVALPPQNLSLAISTRSDPPLPLGRLRATGRLHEIRSSDLAFNQGEATALFNKASNPAIVDSTTIQTLVEGTEGWVTGLRLLQVSANDQRSITDLLQQASSSSPDLRSYLSEEALEAQAPTIQRFLIETSVLDTLDPAVCDATTGQPGSLVILRDLAQSQIFTQCVDPTSNTFRYHRMFRDLLRTKALELEAGRLVELHQNAANWFAANDNPTQLIGHAVACGSLDQAADMLESAWLPFAQAGRIATVESWLETYGSDRWPRHPKLRLVAAWAALNDHRFADVLLLTDPIPADPVLKAQAHALRSHRYRHLGDLFAAKHAALEAKQALELDTTSFSPSPVLITLGIAETLLGSAPEELLREAVRLGQADQIDSSIVSGFSYLALITSLDPDRSSETDAFADQALAYIDSPQLERFHQPSVAHLAKALSQRSHGRLGDATASINHAVRISDTSSEPAIKILILCEQARIVHLQGDNAKARSLVRSAQILLLPEMGDHLAATIKTTRNQTRVAVPIVEALPGAVSLTEREWTILQLLDSGLARSELAEQLFISENTIKTHMRSLRSKLGISGKVDIANRARELGVIRKQG